MTHLNLSATHISLTQSLALCLSQSLSLSIHLSIYPAIQLSSYLSACLSIYLSIYLSMYLSERKQLCGTSFGSGSNSARLTARKRKNPARIPPKLGVDNIKNEAILRDVIQKCQVACRADGLVPMRSAIFPFHLSKGTAPARKKWGRVIPSAAPVTQNHLCKPDDLIFQNATYQEISADVLTCLMKMSLVPRVLRKIHLSGSSSSAKPAIVLEAATKAFHVVLTFGKVQNPLRLVERPKLVRTCGVLYHFDFKICFVPRLHVFFQHLSFQKGSNSQVLFTFWLWHVLRAAAACNFWSLIPARWLRTRGLKPIPFDPPSKPQNTAFHAFDLRSADSLLWLFPHLLLHLSMGPWVRSLTSNFLRLDFDKSLASTFVNPSAVYIFAPLFPGLIRQTMSFTVWPTTSGCVRWDFRRLCRRPWIHIQGMLRCSEKRGNC